MKSGKLIFYVVTVAVFVFGLWGILLLGRYDHAPTYFGGNWLLSADPSPELRVHVAQSGRFVHLKVGDEPVVRLYRESETHDQEARLTIIRLAGNGQTLEVRLPAPDQPDEPTEFLMTGPYTGQWTAARIRDDAGSPARTH